MRSDWYSSEYNICENERAQMEIHLNKVGQWRDIVRGWRDEACALKWYYEGEIRDVTNLNFTQRVWVNAEYDYWGSYGSFNPDMSLGISKPCLADQDAYNEYYLRTNVMDANSRSSYRDCVCYQN